MSNIPHPIEAHANMHGCFLDSGGTFNDRCVRGVCTD